MPTNDAYQLDEAIEKNTKKPRKKKRARRVRSAWISFIGRIIAQFVGSAASIMLALVVVGRHHPVAEPTASATPRPAGISVPTATTVQPGPVIIVLALDQIPRDAHGDLAAVLDAAVARSLAAAASRKPVEILQGNRPLARHRVANTPEAVVARTLDEVPGTSR